MKRRIGRRCCCCKVRILQGKSCRVVGLACFSFLFEQAREWIKWQETLGYDFRRKVLDRNLHGRKEVKHEQLRLVVPLLRMTGGEKDRSEIEGVQAIGQWLLETARAKRCVEQKMPMRRQHGVKRALMAGFRFESKKRNAGTQESISWWASLDEAGERRIRRWDPLPLQQGKTGVADWQCFEDEDVRASRGDLRGERCEGD